MTKKYEIINYLINKYNFTSYLEIGVDNPNNCFNLVNCEKKTAVDPYSDKLQTHEWNEVDKSYHKENIIGEFYELTSNDFFEQLPSTKKFDVIFIDGLHLKEQVLRDVQNSLKHLNKNGFIILHDCLPNCEVEQLETPRPQGWMGTVWYAFAELRLTQKNMELCTIDTDCGLGVIRKKQNGNIPYVCDVWKDNLVLSYEYFSVYKKALMNIISPEEFLQRH